MNDVSRFVPPSEQAPRECYYVSNGERIGPVSEDDLLHLYESEKIFLYTKVWKNGMTDWIEFAETGLVDTSTIPPPLHSYDINNSYVWLLAFTPLIGILIEYIISEALGVPIDELFFITIFLNITFCIIDETKLKRAGYNTKGFLLWTFLLIPVYLFRRAYVVRQRYTYAIIWCISFSILLFATIWPVNDTYTTGPIKNLTPTEVASAIEFVKISELISYPDKTVGEMVEGYFADAQWDAFIAADRFTYVDITGSLSYQGEPAEILIQVRLHEDYIDIYTITLNNEPQDDDFLHYLLEAMYTY